jgi:hypothetical protein
LLVDTLVQTHTEYERWLKLLVSRTTLQAVYEGKDEQRWNPPRITDSKAIDQAAAMVERFHRLIMRTTRQLQNLRRLAPVVMVQNAEQVNVANQQVNSVAGGLKFVCPNCWVSSGSKLRPAIVAHFDCYLS